MKYEIKRFLYRCKCGYVIHVYVDFGTPQDTIRCRKCAAIVERSND